MPIIDPIFIGLDLGTGGVRALAVDQTGQLLASASAAFQAEKPPLPAGWHEQNPLEWWKLSREVIIQLTGQLRQQGGRDQHIAALSVDGTSGTVVGIDAGGSPVTAGLMYNDARAAAEAKELAAAASADKAFIPVAGGIAATHAIAKVRWVQRRAPGAFSDATWFVHQADFIAGSLAGERGVTDYSNALKMGYDLLRECWPAWLDAFPEIRKRLPRVVPPGTRIGTILRKVADDLGLPRHTQIIAGATDGTAGFLASGARNVGDDNTTLGTTLVFKRLAAKPCVDPRGLIYCHKLPGPARGEARWLPGAASNTGCEWMPKGWDFPKLDAASQAMFPIDLVMYPLARAGERFPFLNPDAVKCSSKSPDYEFPAGLGALAVYAAHLQGTALVERLCYETLDAATCEGGSAGTSVRPTLPQPLPEREGSQGTGESREKLAISDLRHRRRPPAEPGANGAEAGGAADSESESRRGDVYTTGGGSKSDVWTQLRADVTGRVYHRPACTESAFGAAILAATGVHYGDLFSAIAAMVRIERTFTPSPVHKPRYDELYERFKAMLRDRGWLRE